MEQWRAMEQWRVVDAHSGGVEAQNGAEGTGPGFRSASDPGICIKEKRKIRIRIRINLMRIRNTASDCGQIQEKELIRGGWQSKIPLPGEILSPGGAVVAHANCPGESIHPEDPTVGRVQGQPAGNAQLWARQPLHIGCNKRNTVSPKQFRSYPLNQPTK
jgi:hypothetical protein